jgi:hypothetical protein
MASGRYRIIDPTIGVFQEEGKQVARTVPKGAVVTLADEKSWDSNALIEVCWEGKSVMMFAQDLRSRCTPAPAAIKEEARIRLVGEVERTRRAYALASSEYNSILKEIPSGIPGPDGAVRVRQAGQKFKDTLRAHSLAVERLNRFVITGLPPQD